MIESVFGRCSGEASAFTVLGVEKAESGSALNTFDAALDVAVSWAEIPFVMSSRARIASLVVALSSERDKRRVLDLNARFVNAAFDVCRVIRACVVKVEPWGQGSNGLSDQTGLMLYRPLEQSDVFMQVPFFSPHPHLSPTAARDELARERRRRYRSCVFMIAQSAS